MEEAIARYLGVFVPFIGTLVCGHLILRTSPSLLLASTGLASRRVLWRALIATTIAAALIVGVDRLTDGELFLRPRFPESQLLVSLLLVALVLVSMIGRSLAPLARWFRRPS